MYQRLKYHQSNIMTMTRITAVLLCLLCLTAVSLNAQDGKTRVISGTVTEAETSEPLPGASILIKGTRTGTYTDIDGKFSIEIPSDDATLEISYIGFQQQSIRIDGKTDKYDVELLPDANMLEEMVVIGYSSKKKENLLGAVSTATVDDVNMRALSSADLLLQGKMAGVMMTQTSAQPGATTSEIRVRGITSIDNNNDPLVIIDGVESSLGSINPKDIESVSVLKDASSAAIYGARAAAGVIIITSKEGKRGMRINYSNSFSLQMATRLPNVVNDPVQYIDLANEAFLNSGLNPKYSETTRQQWVNGEKTPVDWKDLIYRNGFMQDHFVNMSGAGERYDYAVSVGYQDQKGVVYSTKANKFTYKTKVNVHFWEKRLTLGINIMGRTTSSHEAQSANSIVQRYLQNRPILYFKGDDGERTMYGGGSAFYAIEELGGGNDKDFNELSTIFTAKLQPIKGLVFTVNYNMRNNSTSYTKYIPKYQIAASEEITSVTTRRADLTQTDSGTKRNIFNVIGTYNKSFGKHNLEILAGFETMENYNDSHSVHGYDLSKNEPLISLLDPTTITVDASHNEYAIMSYFGRISYDYDGKYLLEANFRRDGSSVFAKGYRYFNSPSLALAWRISKEPFMRNARWLDDLKIRASYGILGNYLVSGNYYAFSDRINPQDNYSFGGTVSTGYGYSVLANPYTTWESIGQLNVGIDFSFLREFTVSAEYFKKKTTDMLSKVYQPLSLGIGENAPAINAGAMQNEGFEVTFDWKHYFNTDVSISASANVGFVKNKVLSLGGNADQWHTTDGRVRSEVGQPFMSLYGYKAIGVYQVDDFTWQDNSDPSIPHMERDYQLKPGKTTTTLHPNPRPGDLLMEDQDGDNEITTNDIVRLGNGRPEVQYAFTLGFEYKGFSLSILAQGQGRSLVYLQTASPYSSAFTGQIFSDYVNRRWTEATPNYRCLYADKERLAIISSYDVYDAAYLRIKNIQLGYTFKGGFLDKIKVSGLSLFLSGENLFTITSFPKGWDPERNVTNGAITSYPLIKSFTGGLILNF